MKEKITGIVLSSIRHSDRYNVTGIYTRERGRMSFLTPAGSGRSGRQAASRLQPLSVIEAQTTVSAARDLYIPRDIGLVRVWRSIYYDPRKSTVAMFLSEFLSRLLRDAPSEPKLWDYIADSTSYFDCLSDPTSIANFHIAFLIGLSALTGIFPDLQDYSEGMEFDMQAGTMVFPFHTLTKGSMRINAEKSTFIPRLVRINYANSRRFRFTGKERSEVLEMAVRYFGCHFPGCDNLKSLDVLKDIFE